MTALKTGMKAPDFNTPCDDGRSVSLSTLAGRPAVLFFYPKDDTPGCTAESCAFRDFKPQFDAAGIAVFGISKDSLKKHEKFRSKYDLNFPLLSDENGTMCEDYGVWVEKSMYGRKYMGIERTTLLIDANGVVLHIWSPVKVPGHVEEVLGIAQTHAKAA